MRLDRIYAAISNRTEWSVDSIDTIGNVGHDTFIVNGSGAAVPAALSFDGGTEDPTGVDVLRISDLTSLDPARLTANQYFGYGEPITFANMEQLYLTYGLGHDTLTLAAVTIYTEIDLGDGYNTLIVGEGLLSTIDFTKLVVQAPTGTADTIEFDNRDSSAPYNFVIDGEGISPMSCAGFERFVLRPGAAGGDVGVYGVPSAGLTIFGGDGNERINVLGYPHDSTTHNR